MNKRQIKDFRQIIKDGAFIPITLNVYSPHFRRIYDVAEGLDLTLEEVATAIFYQAMRYPDDLHPGAPENLK